MVFIFFIFNLYTNNLWEHEISIDNFFNKKYLSIVYAGQDIKSPVSMFGHTFLIAHNESYPEPDAIVLEYLGDTSSSYLWVINSLFFSIKGNYKFSFYMFKQREYDIADRDLWIYKLNKDLLNLTYFKHKLNKRIVNPPRYNFIIKNCSYYIYDLIVEDLNSFPIYTVPIETIMYLNSKNQIEKFYFVPSSLKLVELYSKSAPKKTKVNVKKTLSGFNSSNINADSTTYKNLMAASLNYKIFRESNLDLKQQLAIEKKKYPLVFIQDGSIEKLNPINNNKISYIGVSSYFDNLILTYKPVYTDFYSTYDTDFKFSTLDLFKTSIYFDSNNIKIYGLSIIKIESLISKGFFSKPYVRYLDFSYYNWNLVHKFEDELLIRFGVGYAYNIFDELQISIIPYLGLRFYDISNKYMLRETLGLRFVFQHIINSFMKYKLTFEYDINSYYSYNKLIKFEYLFFNNNKNFNVFKLIDYTDTYNDFKFKLGISLFI